MDYLNDESYSAKLKKLKEHNTVTNGFESHENQEYAVIKLLFLALARRNITFNKNIILVSYI